MEIDEYMSETYSHQIISTTTPPSLPSVIWAARRTLYLGVACGLLLGGLLALLQPTTYTVTATLVFPSAPSSKLGGLLGSSSGDLPSVPLLDGVLLVPQPATSAGTAALIIHSHRTTQAVIEELHLQQEWHLRTLAATYRRFNKGLKCTTGRDGELVIGFCDKAGPQLVMRVTEALLQQLQQQTAQLGLDPARDNLTFLDTQRQQAHAQSLEAQQRLQAFQAQNRLIDVSDQAKALADEYAKIQSDLAEATIAATIADHVVHQVAGSMDSLIRASIDPLALSGASSLSGSSGSVTTTGTLSPLYEKVIALEAELALLRTRLTPNHPDVQSKEQELAIARRVLRDEIQRQLAVLHHGDSPVINAAVVQASVSHFKVAGLQQALRQVEQIIDKVPKMQASYLRLSAELNAAIEAEKLYREEWEKARIIAQTRGKLYEILDPATAPVDHDPGHRLFVLIAFLVLGLGLAAVKPYLDWLRLLDSLTEQQLRAEQVRV